MDNITSKNQKGGITAKNVNIGRINNQTSPPEDKSIWPKILKIIIVVGLLASIVTILAYFNLYPRGKEMNESQENKDNNVNKPKQINVTSYNQSGGITAHTVNLNQQRGILPQAQVKKEKRGDGFILQVILNQTSGVWDPSTVFKLQVKTSGPYKTADIVKGLPSPRFDVRTAENKENGLFAYSTRTAPLKDEPIILEIQSATEIDLVELSVEPLAENGEN